MQENPMTLKVFSPQAEIAKQIREETVTCAADLNGKRIGIVCNFHSGHVEDVENIKKMLNARFKNLTFSEWRSEAPVPLDEKGRIEVLEKAKQCDAVIGLIGK
jgi:L-asparaginase II